MELKTQCRERFKPAVDAINEIIKQEDNTDRPILVAIDGRCGSGKTTLGEYLKGQLDCNLFHMDDFFLRMEQRTPDRMKETGRYCFVSTINILWLSTQLSSICGQNKSKAAHCPSCFSFTPKLSTLFFDVFNQLRIAADEISIKCLVHRLSVHFHHMCDNLFCECRCTSDSVIAP